MRILVIDDHPLIVSSTTGLLQGLFSNVEIHSCESVGEACQLHRSHQFDLVIADLLMPGFQPEEVANLVVAEFQQTKLVFLSSLNRTDELPRRLIEEGWLYLEKSANLKTMASLIASYSQKQSLFVSDPSNPYQSSVRVAGRKPLTHKQVDIMVDLVKGVSVKEIAKHRNVSPDTVRAHIKEAYVRLGATNRAQAVVAFQSAKAFSDALSE